MHTGREPARPLPARRLTGRAALPLWPGGYVPDTAILHRVASGIRALPDGPAPARAADRSAAIARLRRDIGTAIADMWARPTELVRYAG